MRRETGGPGFGGMTGKNIPRCAVGGLPLFMGGMHGGTGAGAGCGRCAHRHRGERSGKTHCPAARGIPPGGIRSGCAPYLSLCREYETLLVVLGLPRHMDGGEGIQAQKVRALGRELEKAGLTVLYQDERLTTVTAEKALVEGGMRREGRRKRWIR